MNENAIALIDHEGEGQSLSPFNNPMPVVSVEMALQRFQQFQQIVSQAMVENQDYGVLPGTKQYMLLKPGAEKLMMFFGLSPNMQLQEKTVNFEAGFFFYRYRVDIYRGHGRDAVKVASCEGSCNSREKKYAFIWIDTEETPTDAEANRMIQEKTGRWKTGAASGFVWQEKSNGRWADTKKRPNKQEADRMKASGQGRWRPAGEGNRIWQKLSPNPFICDLENTISKMAQKRALVGAVLIATNATGFFSHFDGSELEDEIPSASAGRPEPEVQEAEFVDVPEEDVTKFWSLVNTSGFNRQEATKIAEPAVNKRITWAQAVADLTRRISAEKKHEFISSAKQAGKSTADLQPILEAVEAGEIDWDGAKGRI